MLPGGRLLDASHNRTVNQTQSADRSALYKKMYNGFWLSRLPPEVEKKLHRLSDITYMRGRIDPEMPSF